MNAPLERAVGSALDELAQIYITVEQRPTHADAVARLRAIASEYDSPGQYLVVGGWPAFQRSVIVEKPQPGPPAGENEGWRGNEQIQLITTAIAAGNLLIREEAQMPPSASQEVKNEARSIENDVVFRTPGKAAATAVDLKQLRASPKLPPSRPPASQLTPTPPPPPTGVNQGGAGVAQNVIPGGPASEPEIAVSANGKSVVVAQQSTFVTSNDGGLTWPYGGTFTSSTGGDSSLAYGLSGNFYESTIFNSSVGLNYSAAANNGQSFTFLSNAFTCPTSGTNQCAFSTNPNPPTKPAPYPDQPHVAADQINASATGGDQVYVVWRNGNGNYGIACSTNSGQAFGNVQFKPGDFPRVTVGKDGSVYVVYATGVQSSANGTTKSNINLTKFNSCQNGLTVQNFFPLTVASGITFNCPVSGLDRCNNGNLLQSHMVAADDTNPSHIYLTYAQSTSGSNEAIVIRDSTDGGVTWPAARAVTVNSAVNARRFMPWVCTSGGTAWVSWYDRRAATATGATNDLTAYFLGSVTLQGTSLTAGAENNLSGNSDPQCASGWPAGERSPGDASKCSLPQFAGQCLVPGSNPPAGSKAACDFNAPGDRQPNTCQPGETCQVWGGGYPKYGDYNGSACIAATAGRVYGRIYNVWASATPPPGVSPAGTGIGLYFASTDPCGGLDQACCNDQRAPCDAGFVCSLNQASNSLDPPYTCITICGHQGSSCCGVTNEKGGKGTGQEGSCYDGLTCVSGTCACGGQNQRCCEPNGTCDFNLVCADGLCRPTTGNVCAGCRQEYSSCTSTSSCDAHCQCICHNAETNCFLQNGCGPAGYEQCGPPPAGLAPSFGPQRTETEPGAVVKLTRLAANDEPASMTKGQADAILEELKQIRQLLETRQNVGTPAAPPSPQAVKEVTVSIDSDDQSLGRSDAPLTMIEFTDYQCPFCRQFHLQTFNQLKKEFIDTGKVRYISRDLPLGMHEHAPKAAEAARCAADQGKFWEMRDALITNAADLSDDAIVKYAQLQGLDLDPFRKCFSEDAHNSEIQREVADAASLQITGTPTFVIGKVSAGHLMGKEVLGAQPYAVFDKTIREFLPAAPQQ